MDRDLEKLEEMYLCTIEEHPEMANLPKPRIPNPEDDLTDQILDVMNAQTWFMKSTEIMMEYTVEGPEKQYLKYRMDSSKLWLERATRLLGEISSTEDPIKRKVALLRELLWISTFPFFSKFQREYFMPIWNDQIIVWTQRV